MNEIDLNLNSAQCLKEAKDLTGTTVTNICTGETHFVPYGTLDIIGFSVLALLVTVLCLATFVIFRD